MQADELARLEETGVTAGIDAATATDEATATGGATAVTEATEIGETAETEGAKAKVSGSGFGMAILTTAGVGAGLQRTAQ